MMNIRVCLFLNKHHYILPNKLGQDFLLLLLLELEYNFMWKHIGNKGRFEQKWGQKYDNDKSFHEGMQSK